MARKPLQALGITLGCIEVDDALEIAEQTEV